MNQYGAIAQQRWKRWRPASYAAISDPQTYFTDRPTERALRKQPEEVVLAELILLPPESGPDAALGT